MSDGTAKYKLHKNAERLVKCPYCGDECYARGLYLHVLKSSDEDHGGPGEVPDDYESIEPETVGTRDLTINTPTKKTYDHERILCKHCGEAFSGTHGLSIHLARINDTIHPADADVSTSGLRVPAGPNNEPIVEEDMLDGIGDHNIDPSQFSDRSILKKDSDTESDDVDLEPDKDPELSEKGVPIPDLIGLVAHYKKHGNDEAAEDLQRVLRKYT